MDKILRETEFQSVALEDSKVTRHTKPVSPLEVALFKNHSDDSFLAVASIKGFGTYPMQSWGDKPTADREYADILKKLQAGKYHVDIYDSGSFQVTLK